MQPGATNLVDVLPPFQEGLILVVIALAAGLITGSTRRAILGQTMNGWKRAAAGLVFPALVLIATFAATKLPRPYGLTFGDPFVTAWFWFWSLIGVARLVESLVLATHQRRSSRPPLPLLLQRAVMGIAYLLIGFAVLKVVLRQDISALLATSAILSMVLGFALQGVLGNLLGGISMSLARTVEVGDVVGLANLEGEVVETNWRETVIRTRDNDYVHVPNSVLSNERVTNYSKPTKLHRHVVTVGASYTDPPADVMQALVEAAMESPDVLHRPRPAAQTAQFLDFGINYRLLFWTKNYWQNWQIESHVKRLIWYKFKRRGIEIPFPMSDQLLNDMMAVTSHQRRLPVSDDESRRIVESLEDSGFLDSLALPAAEKSSAARLLAEHSRLVRFTEGETLCRQGEAGDTCYVLISGRIDASIDFSDEGGAENSTFSVEPGALFGEMALFSALPRTATGVIGLEAELVEISSRGFARLLASHDSIMQSIAELVAQRNAENRAFLERVRDISPEQLEQSCDVNSILMRLRQLGAWGRRLVGGTSG